jgi:hypothetical protein
MTFFQKPIVGSCEQWKLYNDYNTACYSSPQFPSPHQLFKLLLFSPDVAYFNALILIFFDILFKK